MMNAAMMIAPAPQAGNIKTGGKAPAGQGQLFGQALAQEQQQVVYQTPEQEHPGLPGLPGKGVLLTPLAELLGSDAGQLLELPAEQQDLLEQLDVEMLDGLALLLEQGMVPNSMDHAKLQQLVDLVEEVLPEWQFHIPVVVAEQADEQGVPSEEQDVKTDQHDVTLDHKVEELIAWFSQYQEQQQQFRNPSGKEIGGELPPGQLVAAQKVEQIRERLAQLRATLTAADNSADPVKAEGEAKGTRMAATAVSSAELSARQQSPETSLEARFSELLKPRQPQSGQPQLTESGRQIHLTQQAQQQAQQAQQAQQTPTNQQAAESAEVLFAKAVDKSVSQVPLTQAAINAKQGDVAEGIIPQHSHLHGQPAPVAVAAQGITAPAAAAPFAASQQVADSQIFDQVVTHLSGSDKGDMGRMVLRLHPAELGSLRIELMVEGDRLRANLHAQTQQVQEVLERNLGQLRHSLAEQGLKIDHFQVSSDSRQNQQQGQAEDLARQRHGAEQSADHRHAEDEQLQEDQAIPLAHLTQNGGRGISLHV